MAKMIYNKKKSGRMMGGGGPRDRQEALRLQREQELLGNLRPAMTAKVDSMQEVKSTPNKSIQPKQQTVDLSQYLPLEEVKAKIEEAVKYTRNAEQQKLNSGLNNINNQLKEMRKKASKAEEELINSKVEIRRLKQQVSDSPIVPVEFEKRLLEKDSEISTLNLKLDTKDELHTKAEKEIINLQNRIDSINKSDSNKDESIGKLKAGLESKSKQCTKLNEDMQFYIESADRKEKKLIELNAVMKTKEEEFGKSTIHMTELQDKMDKLYDKIADGSIQALVGSKMTRPALEDKIFIDPLEVGKEPDLDAHIDITEEEPVEEIDSDMMTDLSKLKGLLNLD